MMAQTGQKRGASIAIFFTRFVKPGLVYPVNRHRDPAP
jgi:hypothetical protein